MNDPTQCFVEGGLSLHTWLQESEASLELTATTLVK